MARFLATPTVAIQLESTMIRGTAGATFRVRSGKHFVHPAFSDDERAREKHLSFVLERTAETDCIYSDSHAVGIYMYVYSWTSARSAASVAAHHCCPVVRSGVGGHEGALARRLADSGSLLIFIDLYRTVINDLVIRPHIPPPPPHSSCSSNLTGDASARLQQLHHRQLQTATAARAAAAAAAATAKQLQ